MTLREGNANPDPDAPGTTTKTRHSRRALDLYRGLKAGGVDFAVSLPERVLTPVIELLRTDDEVRSLTCTREDEGVAIAAGAWLGGATTVALMEGSGVGYCGLILARMQICRIPTLIIAGHTRSLGEEHSHHQASADAAEGVLRGLNIPCVLLTSEMDLAWVASQALKTCASQKTSIGLLVPSRLLLEEVDV